MHVLFPRYPLKFRNIINSVDSHFCESQAQNRERFFYKDNFLKA